MSKEINIILGERVKACRTANGYTRENFAEKISVSTRFLADVEGGKVGVSISTLKNISLVLNVSTDYLIGIVNPEQEELQKKSIISKINNIDKKHLCDLDKILECIINISK